MYVNLLGKDTNADDVGDDGEESQNRHGDAFHPKSTTLDSVELFLSQLTAVAGIP